MLAKTYVARMLRWLCDEREAPQAKFMGRYHAIGAKGTAYNLDFGRYSTDRTDDRCWACVDGKRSLEPCHVCEGSALVSRVERGNWIQKGPGDGCRMWLTWIGPDWFTYLRGYASDAELAKGFATLESMMLKEPNSLDLSRWVRRIADEDRRRLDMR